MTFQETTPQLKCFIILLTILTHLKGNREVLQIKWKLHNRPSLKTTELLSSICAVFSPHFVDLSRTKKDLIIIPRYGSSSLSCTLVIDNILNKFLPVYWEIMEKTTAEGQFSLGNVLRVAAQRASLTQMVYLLRLIADISDLELIEFINYSVINSSLGSIKLATSVKEKEEASETREEVYVSKQDSDLNFSPLSRFPKTVSLKP